MRWLISLLVALGMGACTFEDGQPWGAVEMSLETDFDDAGRVQDGGLKTSKDYRVELDSLQIGLVSAIVRTASDSAELSFDPASPPPGYSLCHNGHCHYVDGSLVDYADIEAELAGASAGGESLLQAIESKVDIVKTTDVELGECSNDCELGRVSLRTVELNVGSISWSGRVFDTRAESRLPAEGLKIQGSLPLNLTYSTLVEASTGPQDDVGIRLDLHYAVGAPLLDLFDFAALASEGVVDLSAHAELTQQIEEKLKHDATFTVDVSRF